MKGGTVEMVKPGSVVKYLIGAESRDTKATMERDETAVV